MIEISCVYMCIACKGRGCKKCDYTGCYNKPVSINDMYSGGRNTNRRFMTVQGKSWKRHIADTVLWCGFNGQSKSMPKPVKFELWLKWIFPDNRKRDPDNYIKAVKDSLTGIVYDDDNQVFKEHSEKEIVKGVWSLFILWQVIK